MATICRICKVGKGRAHKMSCNYSKYRQQVVWVDSYSGSTVSVDYDYGSGSSCDTSSYSSSSYSDSSSSSSSSCDSGGF